MKILHIAILVSLIGTFTVLYIQNVHAIPYLSSQDLYKQSDMVFYGQVVSTGPGPGPDSNYYMVKIVTSFKNPQKSDYITVMGNKTGAGIQYPQFEYGDNAIFYIQKINGINTISPYSQIAGNACDIHSFLGPAPIPGEPIMRGAPVSRIYISDAYGNFPEKFPVNHHIVLSSSDILNSYPEARTIIVEMSILNSNEQKIFYKKQGWGYRACDGPGTMQWDFVPTQSGKYTAILVVDNKTTITTSFDVNGSSVNNAQLISSPLKQFKSGIGALDVTCKKGFQLVIKSEDLSPACVTHNASSILVQRGWTHDNTVLPKNLPHVIIPLLNDTENNTIKVVTIKMVPPYTPGGPVIQLTVQNIGTTPITHLNAILETNQNYTFKFQSVTSSTPLISGNSISDTTMLVGGGFQTESTYSLIINGIKDNMPFGFIEKVHIQG